MPTLTIGAVADELLAITFANTYRAVRGVPRDSLAGPAFVREWIAQHPGEHSGDDSDVEPDVDEVTRFVAVRDAIRSLAAAASHREQLPPDAVAMINDAAAGAPRWPRLEVRETGATAVERTTADPVTAALARVAGSAVALFGGPLVTHVRACGNPSCLQFFVTRHHRREWCSEACGNRVRVLRHDRRRRAGT